jgi:hypothetical protein
MSVIYAAPTPEDRLRVALARFVTKTACPDYLREAARDWLTEDET